MSMSCRERVLAAMHREALDRPPVAIFTTCDTIDMMDACGAAWPEAHSDPQKMATLGCAQADYFGLESVRAGFCLTEEAERLGCKMRMGTKNSSPMILSHPYHFDPKKREFEEPEKMEEFMPVEDFCKGGRVKTAIDAMGIMQKTHGKDYVVVGGNTGVFTLTGHLLDAENLIYACWTDKEWAKKWLAAVEPYCRAFGEALHANGADIVQMSEPSASTDILSPEDFQEMSMPYVHHALGELPGMTILHICGDSRKIIPYMYQTGATGISVEEKVPSEEAVKIAAGRGVLVGNVGCAYPLFKGTPEECAAAATRSADAGFDVISAGCGVPIGTPAANIRAMVKAIKSRAPE
jgi:MtaA/CmuA family methyltransferase